MVGCSSSTKKVQWNRDPSYGQMNTPRARMFVMTTAAAATAERATASSAPLAGGGGGHCCIQSVGRLHHRSPAVDLLSTHPPPPPPSTSKEFLIKFRIFMKNTRFCHYYHDGCLTLNVTHSAAAARVGARARDRSPLLPKTRIQITTMREERAEMAEGGRKSGHDTK